METSDKQQIKSFRDLHVYQSLYDAMLDVHKNVLPNLPDSEKFDLRDQMGRASKAGPALIAEGFAKRYQKRQWRKYLNDTLGEANEMIHHLGVCRDVYDSYVSVALCDDLIDRYNTCCKQLTRLGQVWTDYHKEK